MDKIGDDRGTSGLALAGCGGGSRAGPLVTGGRRVQPALGLAWANCVNARLFAAKHDALGNGVVRSLQVVFAPHLPHSYCCFTVAVDGVRGVDDEAEPAEPQQANCTSPSLPVHHHLQPA
ncbi:hypothetical protein HYH03_001855 [Edaphochlamys debaryana]|uniref:Uncharacterized protein n=1 Tax=Edaphochlamys debaryana TaxID=47281 RepID=A0A836C622_9CHLO|nr:hypothetical protein HYH03_001855 [Edaphochlamys debaryana]|eukprot:KAG2500277.1 hypothetical protein HYH03_001855 [Edaphochlamys debaryana]